MFALLNGAPLNGGATSGLWGSGVASSEATSDAFPLVHRYLEGDVQAAATTSGDVYKETVMAAQAMAEASSQGWAVALLAVYGFAMLDAESISSGHPTLLKAVYGDAVLEGQAVSQAAPTLLKAVYGEAVLEGQAVSQAAVNRLAYTSGTSESIAVSGGVGVREVVPTGIGQASAEASVPRVLRITPVAAEPVNAEAVSESLTEIKIFMTGRTIPGVGRSWLAESRLRILRVRQVRARAVGVARSFSRSLPNTRIGFSLIDGEAQSVHQALSMRIYHSARGSSEGTVDASVVPGRITVISGNPTGVAVLRMEPTITRDGVRFSYTSGVLEGRGASWAAGLNITKVALAPVVLEALLVGKAAQIHKGVGQATAEGYIGTPFESRLRINPWKWAAGAADAVAQTDAEPIHYRSIWMEGVADVVAQTDAEPIHYRSIWMEGVADVVAQTDAEPIHYRWVDFGPESLQGLVETAGWVRVYAGARSVVSGLGETSGVGVRQAGAKAFPEALATVLPDSQLIRRWRMVYSESRAGLAGSSAVALRTITAQPAPLIEGNAAASSFTFKINAESPAPDIRTIYVPWSDREVLIPFSDREYRVQ